ncbi:YggS family pyridoxal phosphate-dependent enzyme [Peribacillus glennii]|uniref:Pyridoxal phosphate homeostasis protein n=1 Tax=Peribacillus glennii TaxID=2303991 RepID=A0A372LBU7_9BACI|nr:YggS family pyridoxal phosphate-dependent enzyme [Peribacillus glennii]RFU63357.1 YggS family pyridoxal phosphate-dependent enzyme [Peribacillus glennii]
MKVADNLANIEEKIRQACEKSGRSREEITIIAVTKYVSTIRAIEAVDAGIKNLGENREDGLLEKYTELHGRADFHFIGSLQTRKVKNIIDKVEYIHSLDRISLAEEIQKRAKTPVKCFVQVNVSGEDSKHGIDLSEAVEFVRSLESFDKVVVDGLMTMAPFTQDERLLRDCFRKLKQLQAEVQNQALGNAPCKQLSMGMSNDFPIAIEEGATMIRIGTALVGEDS